MLLSATVKEKWGRALSITLDFVDRRLPPDLYDAYLTPLFDTWSDVLVEISPPAGEILDIACGTGIVSRKLSQSADVKSVEAIDLAPPMIDKAKAITGSESRVAFQIARADQLPFEDDQFNAAVCQQGLQFFPN
ncbi:MAG: class I SAM-dependent methyltransferase [Pseudomonadota bacterium]